MGSESGRSALEQLIWKYLSDPHCSFSAGAFGAVAEFFRGEAEAQLISLRSPMTIATSRGAIRISLPQGTLPVAYESVSARKSRWLQGLALCLPAPKAVGAQRTVVTELGVDPAAIRSSDQGSTLFDLGLATANVDFCVRTGDPELIAELRKFEGKNFLAGGHEFTELLIDANPHRVAISRMGRVEVYQSIGRHRTPDGPHTHVLPKLLRSRRTHDANVSIPVDYLPCLMVYPGNPLDGSDEKAQAYDSGKHLAFQSLLAKWGLEEYVEQKQRVVHAVRKGLDPATFRMPRSRLRRAAVRVALRQLAHEDTSKSHASIWRARFDPTEETGGNP